MLPLPGWSAAPRDGWTTPNRCSRPAPVRPAAGPWTPGACLRSTRSCRPPSGLLLEQLLDAIGGAIGDVGGQLRLEQALVRFHRHLQQLARGRITAAAGERVRHGADLVGAGVEVLACRQQQDRTSVGGGTSGVV